MSRAADALPRLLVGRRRRFFALLVGTGLAQAALVALTAVLMPVLLGSTETWRRVLSAVILLEGALILGLMRSWERVLAEKLGQDYVQEIRTGLVASSLVDRGPSVGITIARTTNDLNSVRNWVALGVTPLAVGVPVIGGTTVALAVLEPLLALAVVVPLGFLAAVLVVLARPSYERSRELRRFRGRLAAHVSDTVHASESIRASGGERRELRHVERRGQRVAEAAVGRARVAGHIRGAAVAAGSIAMVAVAALGSWAAVSGATIATALTIVGVLAGPVSDLGRVVEYRQSYRAARRILAPALAMGVGVGSRVARRDGAEAEAGTEPPTLRVRGLVVDGEAVEDLSAEPGERVVLRSGDPRRVAAVVRALCGLDSQASGRVAISGQPLLDLPGEERRALLGHAVRDLPLERGSISRAVRYQRPDSEEPVEAALERVGLTERVAELPKGESTSLRRGGEPLTTPERGQLRLARALYGDPPVVLIDHLDSQLGADGRHLLRDALRPCQGVVLVTSGDPESFLPDFSVWDLDAAVRLPISRAAATSRSPEPSTSP